MGDQLRGRDQLRGQDQLGGRDQLRVKPISTWRARSAPSQANINLEGEISFVLNSKRSSTYFVVKLPALEQPCILRFPSSLPSPSTSQVYLRSMRTTFGRINRATPCKTCDHLLDHKLLLQTCTRQVILYLVAGDDGHHVVDVRGLHTCR